MASTLTIYGHPASQPSRTVFWACLLNDLPFTLGMRNPSDARGRNPRGQVPSMVEADGFALAEMPAMVCYLADKHGWPDLYPIDLRVRARIQQFLHMHHHLVRLATFKLMAPHVVGPLGNAIPRGDNPLSMLLHELLDASISADDPLQAGRRVVHTITAFLEEFYFDEGSAFVCSTEQASVADLVCYAELGQLRLASLFEFSGYPRTERWLDAMSRLPHHDTIHAYNLALGDIATRPNTLERFQAASAAGIAALTATGLVTL